MALNHKSVATIRRVVDAIHLARLATVRQHRAEIGALEQKREDLSTTSKAALSNPEPDAADFAAMAAWSGWVVRKDSALEKERAHLETHTQEIINTAIRSLGQTRAVQHIEKELEREDKIREERVAERATTALSQSRTKPGSE